MCQIFKLCQDGRCRQVSVTFGTRFKWSLVVVDKWSLFRGRFSTIIVLAIFEVVVVYRWSLTGPYQANSPLRANHKMPPPKQIFYS